MTAGPVPHHDDAGGPSAPASLKPSEGRARCAEDSAGGAGCTKLAVPGENRCAEHLGWPVCPACKRHRVRPGRDVEICETCAADPVHALNLAAELAEQEHYYASGQFARDAQGIEREPQAAKAPF